MRNTTLLTSVLTMLLATLMPITPSWGGNGNTSPAAFNGKKGNPGMIAIKKKAEHVTPDDVRKALSLSWPEESARLLTAEEAGLREGDTRDIGMLNAAALRAIPADCPGIKLDKMYYIYIPPVGRTSNKSNGYIVLDHDFVIDGEVDGKAAGGLITNQRLFYTEHSLNLRKVHVVVEESGLYFTFYINTARGIDQLQVTGCVFEGQGARKGNTFYLGSNDTSPIAGDGRPVSDNCINHILFDSNTHQGKSLVQSGGLRVVESCRFISNTIYDVAGMGICLSTDNKRRHAGLMTYMTCPIYIVGNTFKGVDRVMKKRTSYTSYYCAALVESRCLYMLHNTIRDFVGGKSLYTTVKGEKINGYPATYDLYANVTQLYYCNNHVSNVFRFTKERTNYGILKAKGCGVAKEYTDSHPPVMRYYINNVYDTDRETVMRMWKGLTYPSDGGDYSMEEAYDQSLAPDEYLTYNLVGYSAAIPIDTLAIRNNTIRAVNIAGMLNSSHQICTHFILEGNTFDSRNITSEEYHSRSNEEKMTYNKEWLFSVWGVGKDTSVRIAGNRFTAQKKAIRLMLYKYSNGEAAHARHTTINNNTKPSSSSLVIKSLNRDKWTFSPYTYP